VNGQTGTNTLAVNDAGRVTPSTTSVTPTQVGGGGGDTFFPAGASLTYSDVSTLSVDFGAGDDTVTATPSASTGYDLNGGPQTSADLIDVLTAGGATGPSFTGSPASGQFTFANRQPIDIANFESAQLDGAGVGGSLQLSQATYAVGEAGGTLTVTVTRTGSTLGTVGVSFSTAAGTATDGSDYQAVTGSVTFASGSATPQTFNIPILDDTIFEGDETFTITLAGAFGGATLGAPSSAIVTISENDPAPTFSIDNVSLAEGNSRSTSFVFTVSLSAASGLTATVEAQTANGTADGSDYTTVATPLTFAPGVTTQTVTVQVTGDVVSETNETFFVNLSNPTVATIADDQGIGTIENDDSAPTLSIGDVSIAEGTGGTTSFVFTVTILGATRQTVTVAAATADGTATAAGGDYTSTAASGGTALTFPPGTTSRTFTVPVAGDAVFELDETFFVNLTNPTNATLADGQAQATIQNDDGAPTLSIDDVSRSEGNAGTTGFVFTVTMLGSSSQTVTVQARTADGSAEAGSDYTALSPTLLTFGPGVTSQTVTVQVDGDRLAEPNERCTVNLSDPANATIADARGEGTIQNDDGVSALTVDDVTVAEGSGPGTNAVITVRVSPASGRTETVTAQTVNGTATSGTDYTAIGPIVLTFSPGTTSRAVTVPIVGDAELESDETFFVLLTAPVNAPIADDRGQGLIVDDDQVAASPKSDDEDEKPKETEEQRQQRERTNRSNRSDYATEGTVVAVEPGPDGTYLLVTIGLIRNEKLVVQVFCETVRCPDVRVGDYLEADGYQNGVGDPNTYFVAEDVTVTRNGQKVR